MATDARLHGWRLLSGERPRNAVGNGNGVLRIQPRFGLLEWSGTYYRGIIRALAERGHAITFYEPDAYDRQKHRDGPDPDYARVVVYPGTEAGVTQALRQARDADLVVKCSGVGVFDELLEAAVLEVKHPRALCVFWDVDAPATLDRVHSNPSDPFRSLIPQYDMIFTYGGGPPVVRGYTQLGARECHPIYNALDPHTIPSRPTRDSGGPEFSRQSLARP